MTKDYFDERTHYLNKDKRDRDRRFWGSAYGQRTRFEAIRNHIRPADCSLVDVGCGTGDFLLYLNEQADLPASYIGIDVVPKFIHEARERGLEGEFRVADASNPTAKMPKADWVVANGIFGHRQKDDQTWWERYMNISSRMWAHSRIGIAITFVSVQSPRRNPEAHYSDPEKIAADANKRFCRTPVCDHSYLPNDFLLVARKDAIGS